MKLTTDQAKAYDDIFKWIKNPGDRWCYRLAGYAGTGKTTLLKDLVNGLDKAAYCCAPTGKAASVLEKKLDDAIVTTVHKALYSPISPSAEKLEELLQALKENPGDEKLKEKVKKEKENIKGEKLSFTSKLSPGELKGKFFIVDEASMVNKFMAEDFQKSGANVLFVGDPGQLPPVKDGGWFGEVPANFTLRKVMRQALDNPIIRLSMDIRENGAVDPREYLYPETVIINKSDMIPEEWLKFDQVLTGSNNLRRRINRYFRKNLGKESNWPMEGEKLICLKNSFGSYGFINGVEATALQDAKFDDIGDLRCSILFEDQVNEAVPFYNVPFQQHYTNDVEELPWAMRRDLSEFDWAYAITVHKSQGSEWPKVLLADDGFWLDKPRMRKQWLYTAVTRAKEQLTWVVN